MHVGIANPWWRGKRSRHSHACTTRNFAYLARGPCIWGSRFQIFWMSSLPYTHHVGSLLYDVVNKDQVLLILVIFNITYITCESRCVYTSIYCIKIHPNALMLLLQPSPYIFCRDTPPNIRWSKPWHIWHINSSYMAKSVQHIFSAEICLELLWFPPAAVYVTSITDQMQWMQNYGFTLMC